MGYRKCFDGYGNDTTAACVNYLHSTSTPLIRHLYLIGKPEDPRALRFTDHEAPVFFGDWGTFQPGVIKRGSITARVGLEVQKTSVEWTPDNLPFTQSIKTASPLQLARLHFYDNWPVRIFKVFMPTPGNAMTLGGCDWFGGRVGQVQVARNAIQFSISSFLDVVTQKVPANVIESTSTLSGYTAATLPPGDTTTPRFRIFTGSTTTQLYADCIAPTANHIYSGSLFVAGYICFLDGPGATLAGLWSEVGMNGSFTDGHGNTHSAFTIYTALPWAPTPGADTFYISKAAPINQADGAYYGFPYVPSPTTAV